MQDFTNKMFTYDGEVVDVIETTKSGRIIRRYFDYNSGDGFEEPEIYTGQLYDAPPTAVYDKRIATLKLEIAELQSTKQKVSAETMEAQRLFAQATADRMAIPELARFTRFLNGDFKWILCAGYGTWEIKTFDEAFAATENYDKGALKLATAYGLSNGDVEYQINQYSGGSGSNRTFIPLASKEEGVELARAHLAEAEEYNICHIQTASNLGFDLDIDKHIAYLEKRYEDKRKGDEYNRKTYFKNVEALAQLDAELKNLVAQRENQNNK